VSTLITKAFDPTAITHCGLSDNCNVNSQCVETNDGFVCQCNRGYEGDGFNCCELWGCLL